MMTIASMGLDSTVSSSGLPLLIAAGFALLYFYHKDQQKKNGQP